MTTYLEDLAEGQKIESERRVVSAADIDAFCELSGDHNPLHTDDDLARAAGFAGRIAHGLLVLSIATGLGSEEDDWAIGAYLEASRRFVEPVLPGTEGLKEIARLSGGKAYTATESDKVKEIYAGLGTRLSSRSEKREVTAAFAGGAILLLGAAGALSLRWFGRLI